MKWKSVAQGFPVWTKDTQIMETKIIKSHREDEVNIPNRTLVALVLEFYGNEKNHLSRVYVDPARDVLPSNLITDIDRGELARAAKNLVLHVKGAKKQLKIALTKRGIKIPKGV